MWQIIHIIRAPSGTAFVTSRFDLAIPVFFKSIKSIQLLSDDPHKAVMNTVQCNRVICIQ